MISSGVDLFPLPLVLVSVFLLILSLSPIIPKLNSGTNFGDFVADLQNAISSTPMHTPRNVGQMNLIRNRSAKCGKSQERKTVCRELFKPTCWKDAERLLLTDDGTLTRATKHKSRVERARDPPSRVGLRI